MQLTRLQVPQIPRRKPHQTVREHRRHVEVVLMSLVNLTHAVRESLVPPRELLLTTLLCAAGGEARSNSLAELLLQRVLRELHGPLGSGMAQRQRRPQFRLVEQLPGLVVVRSRGVGDTPVRHGKVGVVVKRIAVTPHSFVVVEAVRPVQRALEPTFSFGRAGGDLPLVLAEVIGVLGWRGEGEVSRHGRGVCRRGGHRV